MEQISVDGHDLAVVARADLFDYLRRKVVRVGVLTVSDRAFAGVYDDQSGPLIEQIIAEELGWPTETRSAVPDELEQIQTVLIKWVDETGLDVVFTTGGTGFAPRDVTPEATRAVIERETPGLAEAMRAASLQVTPHAMLSRAVCGIRTGTLIVNLPGSPKAVEENLGVLLPVLPHAMQLLKEARDSEAGHQFNPSG